MVFYVLGRLMVSLGALMLLPCLCALIYGESLLPFIVPMAAALGLGFLCSFKKPKNSRFLARDGFVSVGLSWIIISLIGCIPYILSGAIPGFVDAFFETVSGFSTTGATVIPDVEAQAKSILFWRTFTHWIGGMGVLVFILAILPRSDMKNSNLMHLMKAEVPGPTVGKLVSKISSTARVLYGIYIVMTLLEFIFLLCGEMDAFEAITHSFSTAGTGGFGVKNDSLASYSAYSQYVVAVFMLLFGTNLNIFFLIITGHFIRAVKSEELRWYFGIILTAVTGVFLTVGLWSVFSEETFRHSLFQVASIISTTGFCTADFELWPVFAQTVLILLMFCGGCAGSTAGGIKVSRLALLFKNGKRELRYIAHPRATISVKIDGKTVEHEVIRGTTSYIIIFMALLVVSVLTVIAIEGCDLITGFTSVATTLNNVGPGLSEIGPTDTFAHLASPTKLILCFDMLAGRLELFPMLMLFSPYAWRRHS